ncbi:uncharacterized protein [Drosophila kikkawai]|uniref:Uncharacterized protein n=1 Tax=Drosophila kikkawai TaxID=30033 RepID=A0ABM4GBR5_DROKI
MDGHEKDQEEKKKLFSPPHSRRASQQRQVSDEALVEREERVWVEVEPPRRWSTHPTAKSVSVSAGTSTRDDALPPRRKKKKAIPPVPRIRRSREDVSQPEFSSVDTLATGGHSQSSLSSLSSASAPPKHQRSKSLSPRSHSSLYHGDRDTEKYPHDIQIRQVDYDSERVSHSPRSHSSSYPGDGDTGKYPHDIQIRQLDYDTEEVLKRGDPSGTPDLSEVSYKAQESTESFRRNYHESCTAGYSFSSRASW